MYWFVGEAQCLALGDESDLRCVELEAYVSVCCFVGDAESALAPVWEVVSFAEVVDLFFCEVWA